jgi:hypothetical protein
MNKTKLLALAFCVGMALGGAKAYACYSDDSTGHGFAAGDPSAYDTCGSTGQSTCWVQACEIDPFACPGDNARAGYVCQHCAFR